MPNNNSSRLRLSAQRAVAAEERQEGLGHRDGTEQVDAHDFARRIERQMRERPAGGNAGIVDQARKRRAVEHLLNFSRAACDCVLIGHIQNERREAVAQPAAQAFAVSLAPHPAEDVKSLLYKKRRRTLVDSRRGPGGDHCSSLHMLAPFIPGYGAV